MQNYAPGGAIQVLFDLRNEAGDVLIPTALRWRVLDEAEAVLQDWAALVPQYLEDQVLLTIPGTLNVLTAPATRGIRSVELDVTTATGSITLSQSVMIQALSQLSLWTNTFLTYAQSLMLAQDFSSGTLAGWEAHPAREDRERALVEAHAAILRMPVVVDGREKILSAGDDPVTGALNRVWSEGNYPDDTRLGAGGSQTWLSYLKPEEFTTTIPPRQMAAIRKAQLLEASAILDANPVLIARRDGLMSMTVGESSQFFRSGKPLEQAMVSTQAIEQLKPYIRYVTKMGRG